MKREPKRMGRPPKYLDRALTPTEHARLYNLRRRARERGETLDVPVRLPPQLAALRDAVACYRVALATDDAQAVRKAGWGLVNTAEAILGEHQ